MLNEKCSVCHDLLASSHEGKAAHYLRYHGVELKKQYAPMDLEKKRQVVARWEFRNVKYLIG
jgi:hypothetical protein